ncbi:hypothetical protein KFU94_63955 [Chloroflexi bacterium TSY]|nr:hypothetical protein [Chloroflexi bacterium TSY]
MIGIVLLAFALRTCQLGHQELRGDEAFGYFFSLQSISEIIEQTIKLAEPHPIGSYVVLHFWLNWAGHSEYALRFVGVWFGTLVVILLMRLGHSLRLSIRSVLFSGFLLAVSPYAIWHSQDARMYGMSLALTVASSWLAVDLVGGGTGRSSYQGDKHLWRPDRMTYGLIWLVAYVCVTLLALHTHYFAAFVVVAQNLFAAWTLLTGRLPRTSRATFSGKEQELDDSGGWDEGAEWRNRIRWLGYWIGIQFLVALLYLPWIVLAGSILTGYDGNGDSPSFFSMLQRSLSVFAVGESLPVAWRVYSGFFAILLLVWSAGYQILSGARGRQHTLFLLLYLFVPLLLTWASATQRPIFNERYLIAAIPGFYLLLGVLIEQAAMDLPVWRQRRIWLVLGVLAVLIFCMGISLKNHYQDPTYSKTIGWRELAAAFDRFSAGLSVRDVRLVENFPDPVLWYYYKGDVEHLVLPPASQDRAGTARLLDELEEIRRIIFVVQPAPQWDNQNIAQEALAERFALIHQENVGAWPVHVYARASSEITSGNLPREYTDAARYENDLHFVGGLVLPTEIAPGGVMQIHLMWDAMQASLSGTEKVFLHLLDPAGQIVTQQDRPLLFNSEGIDEFEASPKASRIITHYGILIPDALPREASNGPYQLIMGLYDPTLEGAPRILTTTGTDSIVLGNFEMIEHE